MGGKFDRKRPVITDPTGKTIKSVVEFRRVFLESLVSKKTLLKSETL